MRVHILRTVIQRRWNKGIFPDSGFRTEFRIMTLPVILNAVQQLWITGRLSGVEASTVRSTIDHVSADDAVILGQILTILQVALILWINTPHRWSRDQNR